MKSECRVYGSDEYPNEVEQLSYFNQCYADFHQAVYRNIFKIVQNESVAEDILQDVFLALWENLYKIDSARTGNWLFVVSYNKSLIHLKRNCRYCELGKLDLADHPEIDEVEFEHKLNLIDEAIERLPERKKEIFRMYKLEGKSLTEISFLTQLSINTIKDHLKIARRMIREFLDRNHLHYSNVDFLLLLLFLK